MKGKTQNTDYLSPIIDFYWLDILLNPVVWDFPGVYVELFLNAINENVITTQDLTLFQVNPFHNHLLNSYAVLGTAFFSPYFDVKPNKC